MAISKQKVHLFLRLSVALAILGILFKISHLNFAGPLLVTGVLGIIIFYGIRFAQRRTKTLLEWSKLFLLIAFLTHYVFHVFHLGFSPLMTSITQFAFVLFLILYIRQVLFMEGKSDGPQAANTAKATHSKVLRYLLYGTATVGIIVGAQFKILHWQFGWVTGDVLLTMGLLAVAVTVIMGWNDTPA